MTKIDATVNDVLRATAVGSIETAIGDSFYGINHRNTPTAIPHNRDFYGLTLFTRPQLNMSAENLRSVRQLIPLLTLEPASIQRAVRSYLDPRLARQGISCPFVDPENPFIPLMTNHCLSSSGWPDIEFQSYISKPGMYKEVFGFIDSVDDLRSAYTITGSFRNMPGSPLLLLSQVWSNYASLVFQGKLVPYPDYLVNNKIDYNTRIWRLSLDPSKTYVQHIGAIGAGYPTMAPMGKIFDYQTDQPVNASNHDIQIQFQCFGATYDDPILIFEFNKLVGIFNSGMRDTNRAAIMQKIEPAALQLFNNRGYPRIDPDTYELQWYVRKDFYDSFVGEYKAYLNALSN